MLGKWQPEYSKRDKQLQSGTLQASVYLIQPLASLRSCGVALLGIGI